MIEQASFAAQMPVRWCPLHFDPSSFLADPELLQALEKHASPFGCEKECVLFRQGDAPSMLYILHQGAATLTMDSAEGVTLLSVPAAPGSLLGLPGLISSRPYTLTAIAKAGAQVSTIPRDKFMDLMRSDPPLSLLVLKVLAAEVRSARRAIE